MSTEYELKYFDARGGAELCRLTFAAAGVKFTETRFGVGTDEFKAGYKPKAPMKALPVLVVKTGKKEDTYCQSGAIAKYIAKKYGLFGSTLEEEFLIDEVYESVMDCQRDFWKFIFIPETDEKRKGERQKNKEEWEKNLRERFFGYFTLRKGDKKYVVGGKLSLADLAVFNMVENMMLANLGDVFDNPKDERADKIKNHHAEIKKDEKIAAYLAKRPETQF